MTSSNVEIFLRIKPVKSQTERIVLDAHENKIEFVIPRDIAQGLVNNQREHYEFIFNGILTPEAKQDEVFERVARPVVNGALEGFNGTIFAYGQTGSGKTFTMTGGAERYVDRGIIPRTISAIFSEIEKRSDQQIQVHISYLEIYNEIGYDLLDREREEKALEDLTRVHVKEDEDGISFRNLSNHLANTEEDALNLLFLGDTNRVIGSTLMNQASSRSHCLFIVSITARKRGEDTVRRSKLNLVDLAGSERVSKTGADGQTLMQAKFINLSLHYLEQVVNALRERSDGMSRPHIPYRNSMMTMALKDSLGGNCRTTMIATVSGDKDQLDESISTCRFAERITCVRNQVIQNEDVDPALVIRRLKQEIRDLNEEIRLLKEKNGEEQRGSLTPDEIGRLQKQIEAFCADTSSEATLNLGGSMLFIRAAFEVFKNLIRNGGGIAPSGGGGGTASVRASISSAASEGNLLKPKGEGYGGGGPVPAEAADQIKTLKKQVQQRDNEINILVSMLQRRDGAQGTGAALPALAGGMPPGLPAAGAGFGPGPGPGSMAGSGGGAQPGAGAGGRGGGGGGGGVEDDVAALMNVSVLADRNKAFELFRKSYRQNEVIEENKLLLKQKYEAAKNMGQVVNDSKERINELKTLIEQRRVQRAMAGDEEGADPEEERCKDLIEQEKRRYKDAFNMLREHKKEIEHLHMMFEQSRVRLQRDFEQWMALMTRQAQQQGLTVPGAMGPGPGAGPSMSPAGPGGASPGMGYALSSGPGSPAFPPARSSMGLPPPGVPAPAPRQAWGDAPAASPASASLLRSSSQGRAMAPGPGSSLGSPAGITMRGVAPPPMPSGGSAGGVGAGVDPAVMELARPYLTGNAEADEDIIKFYEAKHKLMQQMRRPPGPGMAQG